MTLPNANRAFIDDRKLTEYCLSFEHSDGKNKARVFAAALGITKATYFVLKTAILEAVLTESAVFQEETRRGTYWQVDFTLRYLNKFARVRSAWIIRRDEDFPRLVTCFVL